MYVEMQIERFAVYIILNMRYYVFVIEILQMRLKMGDIKQHIKAAYLCLREHNNTIPSEHLELFKNILEEYFDKKEQHNGELSIVPTDSAKFCADQTISSMQRQISDFGDNEALKNTYLKHAKALHFATH